MAYSIAIANEQQTFDSNRIRKEKTIMIKDEYIFLDVDVKTKQEALEFVSTKALELGITDDRDGLLSDFLKREKEYSTGLQDEFAIPHAKSVHAKEVAVFFVKCKNTLEWETLDDTDVRYLFALIVPMENAGNEHLIMISKLATSLLEDDFKEKVKSSDNAAELKEYINKVMTEEN